MPARRQRLRLDDPPALSGALRAADSLALGASLWLASALCGVAWSAPHTVAALWAAAVYQLAALQLDLYRCAGPARLAQQLAGSLGCWLVALLALLALGRVTQGAMQFSAALAWSWAVLSPLGLLGLRLALLPRLLREPPGAGQRVAIAGLSPLARRIAETLAAQPWRGLRLVGCFDDGEPDEAVGLPRAGSLEELRKAAAQGELELVYVALPLGGELRAERLLRQLADTPVAALLVWDLHGLSPLRPRSALLGSLGAVSLLEQPLDRAQRFAKRCEDLLIAGALLVLLALPMLALAAAVKLSSPGPVFYRQRRYGLGGRQIRVWKFRTLVVCESSAQFRQVRAGDARITRLGRVLRRSSLDELPQLFNVLAGSMSLVGPRPHPLLLDDQHRDAIAWYALRSSVKPGITGWAQVNGCRGETSGAGAMQRRVDYDLEYIRNWSLPFDLAVLLLTLLRVAVGKGAV
jgi:putative colanic acid biosynthesis UDP-glucose lipid carrier transferase